MTIEKLYNGAFLICDIENGYLRQQTFIGYSEKKAIVLFKKGKK